MDTLGSNLTQVKNLLYAAFCCASISFILFRTDALFYYSKLFRLNKFRFWNTILCMYISRHEFEKELSILEFLKARFGHSSFLAALVGCPFCIGFFLSIGFGIAYSVPPLACYFVYILMYKLLTKD